ncbi:sodium-dependent transporter [Thermodesulfatator autotrophicus]|uniref:Sodium:calcium symporter n=1 Tax=Thermodesulfatator autotrophicus TaxID=1795632 RepID=A0A177E5G9_9BACT|nr:sodium-dependent transporter [Thermodesulfatator autotrophicus]OAG27213.1 sodium:calcium symporter [Thermodesulfatator autotrophicus]
MAPREHWATRIGLILAMAGNAVGLGNFLRFPTQAAENGGGVFMIPYMISLVLIAIPLMWVEWAIGRYGGVRGHGTTPAIFKLLWNHPLAKYIGVLGLFVPFVVSCYYVYIESWTLGYALLSLFGALPHPSTAELSSPEAYLAPFKEFLSQYTGMGEGPFYHPSYLAYFFFILTIVLNIYVLIKGISGGIERLAKIAMPLLFLFAIILLVRVLTLETPYGTAVAGLNFLWEPKWSELANPKIWLAAAGQVFFTLSLGFGAIITYASYLKRNDDITLSALTASSLNEAAEVILGASIAIPAAAAFFGVAAAQAIAASGAFNLAFVSLPAIFANIPFGDIFGFLWFILLFFAGLTSSVAITQPIIAFLQDEFRLERKHAVLATMGVLFSIAHVAIFLPGSLDEMDFWAGTFFVVVFALCEVLIFFWAFSPSKAWAEINRGGFIKLPRIFFYIMKYVTPVFLFLIIIWWVVTILPSYLAQSTWTSWLTRQLLITIMAALCFLVYLQDKKRRKRK